MLLKTGKYNGVVKDVKQVLREITNGVNKGKKYTQIVLTVILKNEEGEIKELPARYNSEYAIKYFKNYCGISSADLKGKAVNTTVVIKSFVPDGETNEVQFNEIKFCNLLDSEGNPIIMPREEAEANNVTLF